MRFFGREDDEPARCIMFLCVENAGRSQMAAALAERERDRRGLEGKVDIQSAGTRPADAVYDPVVQALAEVNIDISDRTPSLVQLEELEKMDYVVMMGCYIAEFNPATFGVDVRDWDLPNPDGAELDDVREIRDEIESRVAALFDDLEREVRSSA